jgi:hypothetical protein
MRVLINSLVECIAHFIEINKPLRVKLIDDFFGKAKYDEPAGRVGGLMKKYLTNAFGFEDNRYYWIVYRKKGWFPEWASPRYADKPRFRGTKGCSISSKIFSSMKMENKYRNLGALAIGFMDGSYAYVRCHDLIKFVEKYDTMFDNPHYNQVDVGLAAEITKAEDPFKVNN